MAWLDGLLGGGGGDPLDIYGDLFSKEQKAALAQRSAGEGLLRMAGAFGQAAQPSRLPTSFMGALGQAAGALAGSGDEAAKTAISGMKVAEDVRRSRQERELIAQMSPIARNLYERLRGRGVPAAQAAAAAVQAAPTASTVPPAAAADVPVPAGAPQPPGAPPLNAYGMPPPRNNTAFGIPQRPGQPPLTPEESVGTQSLAPPEAPLPPPRVTGKGVMPPGGLITPDDYNRYLGITPAGPQQNAGLLPLPPGAPPGQLQGPGVLASLAAGGGAPPPFSSGGPMAMAAAGPDLSNFTAADAGGGGDDGGGNWQRDKLLIKKYESGGRNIEQQIVGPRGGYNPSVGRVTGPSSASGPFQMIDPTWRHAASLAGIDTKQYPRAINAPEELQDKAAEALYREQGLKPWAPYNKALAAATGYRGGGTRMAGAPDLSNMAGDAGGGGDAAPARGGGGFLPGTDITPEELGAFNAMADLAGVKSPFKSLLDTYYKSPGYLGEAETAKEKAKIAEQEPFQKRQKMLDFHLDMRKNGFLIDDQGQVVEDPSYVTATGKRAERSEELKLKYQKQQKTFEEQITIEQEKRADQRQVVTTPVYGPDGRIVQQEMLQSDRLKKLRDQTMRPGEYKPGDIVAKPIGDPPPGHEWRMTPQGELRADPVAGTPAAQAAGTTTEKKQEAQYQMMQARDIVVGNVDRIEQMMESAVLPTTGWAGSYLSQWGGTAAKNIAARVETLKSRASIDEINRIRNSNPTGAAFGSLSNQEGDKVAAAQVALDQAQTADEFRDALQNLKQIYIDATTRARLPDTPVLKVPRRDGANMPPAAAGAPIDKAAFDALPSGSVFTAPDGSRRVKP